MKVSFNVNHTANVVLRKKGAEILNRNRDELIAMFPNATMERTTYNEGDTYSDQLWEIMQVFGNAMTIGFDPPIETEITVDVPDYHKGNDCGKN